MKTKIIDSVMSLSGIRYYVRYDYEDNLLQVSTSAKGPWLIIRDQYELDENALEYAKQYVDSFTA